MDVAEGCSPVETSRVRRSEGGVGLVPGAQETSSFSMGGKTGKSGYAGSVGRDVQASADPSVAVVSKSDILQNKAPIPEARTENPDKKKGTIAGMPSEASLCGQDTKGQTGKGSSDNKMGMTSLQMGEARGSGKEEGKHWSTPDSSGLSSGQPERPKGQKAGLQGEDHEEQAGPESGSLGVQPQLLREREESQQDKLSEGGLDGVMNWRWRGGDPVPRNEEEAQLSKKVARDTPEHVFSNPSRCGKIEVDREAMVIKVWSFRHNASLTSSGIVYMKRCLLETKSEKTSGRRFSPRFPRLG